VTYAVVGGLLTLGAVPVEMSTVGALAIRNDFEVKPETDHKILQLLGLANEYASYSATESEYAAQDYMGASTLYGPAEARFFRCEIGKLRDAAQLPPFEVPKAVMNPGPPHRKEGNIFLLILSRIGVNFPV